MKKFKIKNSFQEPFSNPTVDKVSTYYDAILTYTTSLGGSTEKPFHSLNFNSDDREDVMTKPNPKPDNDDTIPKEMFEDWQKLSKNMSKLEKIESLKQFTRDCLTKNPDKSFSIILKHILEENFLHEDPKTLFSNRKADIDESFNQTSHGKAIALGKIFSETIF